MHFMDLYLDTVKNAPVILVSIISGYIGSQARIFLDEQELGDMLIKIKELNKLSTQRKDEPPGSKHGAMRRRWSLSPMTQFKLKNHFIGMVAAFVAIITLAQDLSVLHQAVIGMLTSMVGGSWLMARLDGGDKQSSFTRYVQKQFQGKMNTIIQASNKLPQSPVNGDRSSGKDDPPAADTTAGAS